MPTAQPEFDQYAAGYDAGMDNPVKALLGESGDDFVAVKQRWLMHRFPALRGSGEPVRLLDYGCGTATLLRLLARAGASARFAGSDISPGMLGEAARTWPSDTARPDLRVQDGPVTPFAAASFDLVVISAVLHHVPPAERGPVYAELHRLLAPGGSVVVFEHNPWNPVTRYVVARTPIDRHAILLPAPEVTSALQPAGFQEIRTRGLMYLPPRFGALADALDRRIGFVPFGAQYAVTARKPCRNA